jgi:hypothetical protein
MSQHVPRSTNALFVFAAALILAVLQPGYGAAEELPPGLSDTDPMVRLLAVQEVERTTLKAAIPKLAVMAKEDTFDAVREAACKALGTLGATDRIELLSEIAANDSNANVRASAAEAVRGLGGMLLDDRRSQKTSMEPLRPEKETRRFAAGIGTMGGYGMISLDLRGRFATGWSALPWIGIEVGGGWTPPGAYLVTAGPLENADNDDYRMLIFSAAGAVLLYPGRIHYAALRGGFDVGRGGYGVIAYGLEMLDDKGFFSWGVEGGILIQPGISNWIDRICEGDECAEDLWPVIPCVRFSVQIYPL